MIMDAPDTQPGLPQPEDYGTEVLCAGWNPLVAAAVEPVKHVSRKLPADSSAVDADVFLKQFYRSQKS
jgi:hypothetical protein